MAATAVPAQDRATLERLRRLLDEEEVWRREDLTIGQLAEQAGVPEHRLRKIINEGLGYRNFAAFLGERRVTAAKAALADPESGRKTVSSIAYEAGFNSLASFNRVFREIAGTTPTAFRQQALGASIPETPAQN
jgi:AraC-like DNA-binding protein